MDHRSAGTQRRMINVGQPPVSTKECLRAESSERTARRLHPVGTFPCIIVYQHAACAADLITWRMPLYQPPFPLFYHGGCDERRVSSVEQPCHDTDEMIDWLIPGLEGNALRWNHAGKISANPGTFYMGYRVSERWIRLDLGKDDSLWVR